MDAQFQGTDVRFQGSVERVEGRENSLYDKQV